MQLLAHGAGHQKIPGICHQLHHGQLQVSGPGSHQCKAGKLSGGGIVGEAGEHGLKSGKTGIFRGNSQSKGHSQISERNGDTVTQSL